MKNKKWGIQNIPEQKDKTIIITGATSGLGKEATRVLAMKNATVIMAVRNTPKAKIVASEIRKEYANVKIDIRSLDLSCLDSISSFAKGVLEDYKNLDILINNAGIMMCPYSKTKNGFETQMGTNHLGPFALTGLLMPLLMSTKNARIVSTSSVAHNQGDIDFTDINWEKRKYNTNKAYSDSKLANLYFSYELKRRLENVENPPLVVTAHPGGTKTDLARHSGIFNVFMNLLFLPVEKGVLSTLRAATDVNAKSGDYYGPGGFMQVRGFPELVQSSKMSHNLTNAKHLWDLSEQLTDVQY
ncbi:MAG: short-chain dehydrogenase [Gammaproteobacteria bacterium]|nr:short-chain dehydrogenase [Gammaproteobacteria bacterium]